MSLEHATQTAEPSLVAVARKYCFVHAVASVGAFTVPIGMLGYMMMDKQQERTK